MKHAIAALALATALIAQPVLKKQVKDGAPLQDLTAAERSALGDPLFRLVLKDHPGELRLDEIERLIKGASGTAQLFVVDEKIVDPALGQQRRAVLAFSGSNQGVLNPNVMLSFIFDSTGILPGFIEAWGWDDARSRYNYYKADGTPPSWKFRISSIDADNATPAARQGTCLACHINGGPVMKELLFPWNNWHSFRSSAAYLNGVGAGHWPISEGAGFRELKGAEDMETNFIVPAIRQFNARRLNALVRNAPGGLQEISDGPRALRQLFGTTEYNLISSSDFSGLHPFPAKGTGPAMPFKAPDTFFLNANLIAGGGPTQYQGLGIAEARNFAPLLQLQPAEYKKLVDDSGTKLGGKTGDANFAWFVPEPSHQDNNMIDTLLQRGVVTPQFVAAVLAVDLETPVFSTRTPGLAKLIPPTFRFKPRDGGAPAAHPDALTQAVIAKLQATPPAAGTPEADFLVLLKDPDPVKILRQRVNAYLAREQGKLSAPATRQAELKRLFDVMAARRRTARDHPILKSLNETGNLLFPLP
jgi:hypothetical protein